MRKEQRSRSSLLRSPSPTDEEEEEEEEEEDDDDDDDDDDDEGGEERTPPLSLSRSLSPEAAAAAASARSLAAGWSAKATPTTPLLPGQRPHHQQRDCNVTKWAKVGEMKCLRREKTFLPTHVSGCGTEARRREGLETLTQFGRRGG